MPRCTLEEEATAVTVTEVGAIERLQTISVTEAGIRTFSHPSYYFESQFARLISQCVVNAYLYAGAYQAGLATTSSNNSKTLVLINL